MKLNKKLFWLVCLMGVIAFTGYAASAVVIGETWKEHDNPKYEHFMFRYGSTEADAQAKHFQITQAWWDKMKMLPTFSEKKMPGLKGRPMWTEASGDWEFNQANVVKFVPTNQELRAYWRDLANSATGKQRMAIKLIGEFPVGYPIELLIFTKTPDNKPVTEPEELHALGKPIVWLQGPIHGGEQDAADGISWEAYSLATGEWDEYLEKVSIILLPRINQDGAMMMTRGSNIRYDKVIWNTGAGSGFWSVSDNIDMNRDNLWFDMPSLRAIHTAFNAYYPEVAVDHHMMRHSRNYFGGFVPMKDDNGNIIYKDGRPQLLVSRDAAGNPILNANSGLINMAPADPRQATMGMNGTTDMFHTWDITLQYGDHLNNPRELMEYYLEKFQPWVTTYLKERGVGSHHYIDGVIGAMDPDRYGPYYTGLLDARNNNIPDGTGIPSGANEGAMFDPAHMFNGLPLKPCLSFLVESRGNNVGAWNYPKRVYSQWTSGKAIISFTAQYADEVKNLVADVRNKITETGKRSYPNSSYEMDTVYNLMKMVNRTVTSEDWITADGRRVTLRTAFWNTGGAQPMVSRVRPTAYILPLSKMNADVAKRLIFNGAQVEVLNEATPIQVEDFGEANPMPSKRFHDNTRRIVIAPSEANMNDPNKLKDPKFTPWSPPFWIEEKDTPLEVKTITFPKGSFVIYMSQPTARTLATVLEPDAERSYTRWSLARKTYADENATVCVPYRYMKEERLNTTPLFMAWPQATGAGFMEVEPLSGTELEQLAAQEPFNGKKIVVAETLHAYVDSAITMSFSFLSREELRRDMPNADFYFWNYNTNNYDLLQRNADGSVFVGEDYWGPFGEYGIQPIQFVATVGADSGNGGTGGGCDAGFGLIALAVLVPFAFKRR